MTKPNEKITGYAIASTTLRWYIRHLAADLNCLRKELIRLPVLPKRRPTQL